MLQVHYQNQEKEWSLNDLITICVAKKERHKKGKAKSAHLTLQSGMKKLSINAANKKSFKKRSLQEKYKSERIPEGKPEGHSS